MWTCNCEIKSRKYLLKCFVLWGQKQASIKWCSTTVWFKHSSKYLPIVLRAFKWWFFGGIIALKVAIRQINFWSHLGSKCPRRADLGSVSPAQIPRIQADSKVWRTDLRSADTSCRTLFIKHIHMSEHIRTCTTEWTCKCVENVCVLDVLLLLRIFLFRRMQGSHCEGPRPSVSLMLWVSALCLHNNNLFFSHLIHYFYWENALVWRPGQRRGEDSRSHWFRSGVHKVSDFY